jgi:anti-anti-sigma regulatory factor
MLDVHGTDRIATLSLLERADVSTALAMHELMIRADLERIDSVEIDASAAMKLDASVLQLLVAWLNLLNSHHIPWRWRGMSEAFSAAAGHAGLLQIFRLADG